LIDGVMRRAAVAVCMAVLPTTMPAHAAAAPTAPAASPAVASLMPPAGVMAALRQAGLPASSLGFYAREVASPRPLAALNEEQPFVLASTTKVVTSLAALDLLGPNFRWRTYAYAQGPLIDGRLAGDLLIVGGGDARLGTDDLRQWFVQMRERGLREIAGNIVLDRFAFQLSRTDHANTPLPGLDRPHHIWPDAFSLDEGIARVAVLPARGAAAMLTLSPPLAGVTLVNQVRMADGARGGCNAHARVGSEAGAAGDSGRGAALQVLVSGTWSRGCGERHIEFVPLSHGEFTTRAVAGLWAQAGGVLRGGVVDRAADGGSAVLQRDAAGDLVLPWAIHQSDKLPQVVHDINKTSNNLGARNLLLSLSQGFPLKAATLAGAQSRVHRWLLGQGLGEDDIRIDNGSGLSRTERGKPRAMVQLLCNAWLGRNAQPFVDSLPIAGVDGTLAHRMRHGLATGHAYLKTGTLLDARALAGYVRARSGKVYAVAAMVNHPGAARATPALDALIEWLARYG
jgi:D-alanyl-D-alanine carboxypeptidase/D-alanyl-D-alanine-endopeptidase (penicillin-binding protein 4)